MIFDNTIKFKYKWRPYQKRILDEIDLHLNDEKLHVIAPPGSGKTVLGLEVIRRLGKPALILSPGITVRNQWIERFQQLFVNGEFSSLSVDINQLENITSITYQALHKASCQLLQNEISSIEESSLFTNYSSNVLIEKLKSTGVGTIVLDEAHHLKTEWWKSLTSVLEQLDNIKIVSLTATPPFDCSALQWARYSELCGPVDCQISVPELVHEKNLCPHQDLVYLSEPADTEKAEVDSFYLKAERIKNDFLCSNAIEELYLSHPLVRIPEDYLEFIYDNLVYCTAITVFLKYKQNKEYIDLARIIGYRKKNIPIMNDYWFEQLLSFGLFNDSYLTGFPAIIDLANILTNAGFIENKKTIFSRNSAFDKMLASSTTKFKSISDIVDIEYRNLDKDLRLVILSDYIRKDVLQSKTEIKKFGVVPIFKYLYDTNSATNFDFSSTMAVLSGSFSVIPESVSNVFFDYAEKYSVPKQSIIFREVQGIKGYKEVILSTSFSNLIVPIMTELFSEGYFNILIGTKSLLGEGWDCPVINSLIMATFVGSYMLSNQIRGRAIRTYSGDPHKTANIWHLMCIDTKNPDNNNDYETLKNRFRHFAGLDIHDELIINGLQRLHLPELTGKSINIDSYNSAALKLASSREQLFDRWMKAVEHVEEARMVKQLFTSPAYFLKRGFLFKPLLFRTGLQGVTLIFNFYIIFKYLIKIEGTELHPLYYLLVGLGFSFFLSLIPGVFKSMKELFAHRNIDSSFNQIALSVLVSMRELNLFDDPVWVSVMAETDDFGNLKCLISNCSEYSQKLFYTALSEIIKPVENPQYLICKKSGIISKRSRFYSVPSIFSKNSKTAAIFFANWEKRMGKSQFVNTRREAGKKVLVSARIEQVHSRNIQTEIFDCWTKF
jgi:superfamily II DNA or RNA helicase